jgi:hypothetical protein
MPYFTNVWTNASGMSCQCSDCGKVMPLLESMSHQCEKTDAGDNERGEQASPEGKPCPG